MSLPVPPNASRAGWGAARAASVCALLVGTFVSACQGLLGEVDLSDGPAGSPPAGGAAGLPQIVIPPLLPAPGGGGGTSSSSSGSPEAPGGATPLAPPSAASPDAGLSEGAPGTSTDAGSPPPEPPRPLTVAAPAPLPLVGFNGGGPRLGTCQGGISIGIRPTANPSTDTFGQRLVFLEPICARASWLPGAGALGGGSIVLTRDDALLSWDATEPMLGPPSFEVPDERLLWVPQPETLCPAGAPALVGLTGAYDPAPEDGSATATIRSLVLECAPLAITEDGSDVAAEVGGHLLVSRADSFAGTGSAEYRSACEGGAVLSQLMIHSGFWLDGFVLGCSTLHGAVGSAPSN